MSAEALPRVLRDVVRRHLLQSGEARRIRGWVVGALEQSSVPLEALRIASEAADESAIARLLKQWGGRLVSRGHADRVIDALGRLQPLMLDADPSLQRLAARFDALEGRSALAAQRLARLSQMVSTPEERMDLQIALHACARRYGYGSQDLSDDFGDDPCQQASLAIMHFMKGHQMARAFERAQALTRSAWTDPGIQEHITALYGFFGHLYSGRFLDGAEIVCREAARCAALGPRSLEHGLLYIHEAVLLLLAGEAQRARTRLREATAWLPNSAFLEAAYYLTEAMIELELGELDACERAIGRLLEREVPFQLEPWYRRTCILLALRRGDPRRASELADGLDRVLTTSELRRGVFGPESLLSIAAARADLGDLEGALCYTTEALAIAQEGGMSYWVVKSAMWCASVEQRRGADCTGHLTLALNQTTSVTQIRCWQRSDVAAVAPLLAMAATSAALAPKVEEILGGLSPSRRRAFVRCGPSTLAYNREPLRTCMPKDGINDAPTYVELAESAPLRLETLGGFSMYYRGKRIDFGRKAKLILLIKFLASRDHYCTSDAGLEDEIWSEANGKEADDSIRHALSRMRRTLGLDDGLELIESGEFGFRLADPALLALDARCFEDAIAGLEVERGPERLRALQCACALYRGEFLPNDTDRSFTIAMRSRLKEMYQRPSREIVTGLYGMGHYEQAVEAARTYHERCDLPDERILLALVESLVRLNDVCDAARELEQWCKKARPVESCKLSRDSQMRLEGLLGSLPSSVSGHIVVAHPHASSAVIKLPGSRGSHSDTG